MKSEGTGAQALYRPQDEGSVDLALYSFSIREIPSVLEESVGALFFETEAFC
ncbi:hypothetical protein [Cyclobacterium plantarum]|uniref:hypothetical protein n=1 Tax=Cyclobacterium plantarum TaxID=2716263 RepID=UPI003F72B0FB